MTHITQQLNTMIADGDDQTPVDCFIVSAVWISVSNRREEITQGLEQVVTACAERFYHTLHHLMVTDPTSSGLRNMHRHYDEVFPRRIDFTGFPSRHTVAMTENLIRGFWSYNRVIWRDGDRPSDDEHIRFARDIAELAQVEHQRGQRAPDSVLNFALQSMFLDPLPPTSIVAGCLKVIAIALGCDISDVATSDQRCVCLSLINTNLLTTLSVQVEVVLNLITRRLEMMVGADQDTVTSENSGAVCALTPYAIFLEKHGQQDLANAIMQVFRSSSDYYLMSSAQPHITTLLGKPNSPFRNWLIALVARQVSWEDEELGEDLVVAWAAAVSTVPDTEEVIQSVVSLLMWITNIDSLRPHIPIEIWVWMKKWQHLPVANWPRYSVTTLDTVRHARGLGDFEIIGSYFLAVWVSYPSSADVLNEVEMSIRGDFGGIWMWHPREFLLSRLDGILKEMVAETEQSVLQRCRKLKRVLLDMDGEATKTLTGKLLQLVLLDKHTNLHGRIQDLIPPSCALCLCIVSDHSGWFVLLRLAPSRHLAPLRTTIHHTSPLHSRSLLTVA